MADIFISYSRKDSEHALALAERLRATGASIWMDSVSLAAAETWSGEIVHAIKECKTMIVLLSPDSIASHNVTKEVGLASEKKNTIIPIELAACELSDAMEYALAGLHRISLFDEEALKRSFEKLGISGTDAPFRRTFSPSIQPPDPRKSLIVLPFEDLSPTGEDNAWFADGLAGEMIDSLGHIKSLRILDRKTSIGLRNTKLRTVEIGKEFNTRYFIEGSVRKYGEQIKISVALLDIETGDYLWQESHRGEFEDIFDIQEVVAEKVVQGLKLHLTKEEKTLVEDRGTENAEAYELFVRAFEYSERHTLIGYHHAIQLWSDAIHLDPNYINAYLSKCLALTNIYHSYNRDAKLLVEAERLVQEVLRLKPNIWEAYRALSVVYMLQGKLAEAEKAARLYVEKAPEEYMSHHGLGYFYMNTGEPAKAIEQLEEVVRLKPDSLMDLFNLVNTCNLKGDLVKCKHWALYTIPYYERHLKLYPDDEATRVNYANLLHYGGRNEEARQAGEALGGVSDGASLINVACLWVNLGNSEKAIKIFRKAIEAGFRKMSFMKSFLNAEELLAFHDAPRL